MKIASIPDNYAGAFSDVIYTISETVPEQIVEVTVIDDATLETLGMKRYKGQTQYGVNIANYVKRRMGAKPEAYGFSTSYRPEGRTVKAKIRTGALTSETRTFISGHKNGRQFAVMSDAPFEQSLAPGEIDEISVIGAAGSPMFLYAYLVKKGTDIHEHALAMSGMTDGVLSFQINADELEHAAKSKSLGDLGEYTHLALSLEAGGTFKPVREYALRPRSNNAVRMCWVNPYGALDFYTFAKTGGETVVARRKKIYAERGYECCGAYSEKYLTVESAYENPQTLMWLSTIICSPKAWIYSGGGFTEVDIVTGNVEADTAAPSSIRITMREKKRKNHQTF